MSYLKSGRQFWKNKNNFLDAQNNNNNSNNKTKTTKKKFF